MYIVRWLMGHPILATWVLGAIAILLTMDAGNKASHVVQENASHSVESSEKVKDRHDENVEAKAVHAVEKKSVDEAPSSKVAENKTDNTIQATTVEKKKEKEQAKASVNPTPAPVANTITSTVDGVALMVVSDSTPLEDGEVEVIEKLSPPQDESAPDTVAVISVQDDKPPTSDDVPPQAAQIQQVVATPQKVSESSADLGQASAVDMLRMAREAYWNNGLEESAEIYNELIKLEPNVVEYKGELGNVYWKLGNQKKAAELYADIALPMIQRGNVDRVASMVGFIGLFYPDRATAIQQKIMSLQK